jgi:NADPH:quinone reductase-like Zn-dependent oxidoreductase
MKAVECTKYGPPEVLKIVEIEKPVPRNNEVLIKVMATTTHIGDTKIRRLAPGIGPFIDPFIKFMMWFVIGFRGPRKKILGMELSGIIESIGKDVTMFNPGDEVFASTELKFGGYAQYACLPEKCTMTLKPTNMTHEEAAPLSNGGLTALVSLRKAKTQPGQKLLIYGASGSVGTYAIQIAKHFGAEVTAVCSSVNIELVKSLGADKVIDYTKEDFTENGETYDAIFDAVGKLPSSKRKKSLKESGAFVSVFGLSGNVILNVKELIFLKELSEAGKLKSVIDKQYTLDQIVEAHKYVDKGHKKGNVVITVNHD